MRGAWLEGELNPLPFLVFAEIRENGGGGGGVGGEKKKEGETGKGGGGGGGGRAQQIWLSVELDNTDLLADFSELFNLV